MAILRLNKNLETQFELDLHIVNEDIAQHILTGTANYPLAPGETPPIIPALPTKNITTIEIEKSSGIFIPLACSYNKVFTYNTTYQDTTPLYEVHITMGYETPVNK